jgi:hypothetical protein
MCGEQLHTSKTCTKCSVPKGLSEFHKNPTGADGLQSRCKACQKAAKNEWGAKNAHAVRQKAKDAYWAAPEKHRTRALARHYADVELSHQRRAASYLKHRLRRRAAINARNAQDALKVRAARRAYYAANIKTEPAKVLRLRMRARLRAAMKSKLEGQKVGRSFLDLFGYSAEDLVKHITSKFTQGMTAEALLSGRIHIDHIRPVVSFNASGVDCPEFKACWALSNLQPLWAEDNLRKGAR